MRSGAGRTSRGRRRAQASRSSAAARSGATTHRCSPVPSSSPASGVRRGRMSIRQQKESAPARRGADPQVERRRGAEAARAGRCSASWSSAAPDGPSSSKRARGAARGEHELERQPRGVRRHQHRLVVDRDEPLAPPHLLLHEVGQQVAAHRPHRVGAEALALAGDAARARSRARRAARGCAGSEAPASRRSLTIRCTYAAPSCARIRARQASTAAATCSAASSASEATGSGALTITSWRARGAAAR